MKSISILGAGTWGIALARLLANNGNDVTVWSAFDIEVKNLSETHTHPNLKGMHIPTSIKFTTSVYEASFGKQIIIFAVPSAHIVNVVEQFSNPCHIDKRSIIACVSKGMDPLTLNTMTQIIEYFIPDRKYVALSGPTHAEEVALDMPTTIVAASTDVLASITLQKVLTNDNFKVFLSPDVYGVELCGAFKNIIAMACGIAKGAGYGDNATAALITKGLEELRKLGERLGCHQDTFYGLAGMGDLIVTATSMHSRNNKFGILIGSGVSRHGALLSVGQTVEGLDAISSALRLACSNHMKMPIIECVWEILEGKITPQDAKKILMSN